eukprot:394002_1
MEPTIIENFCLIEMSLSDSINPNSRLKFREVGFLWIGLSSAALFPIAMFGVMALRYGPPPPIIVCPIIVFCLLLAIIPLSFVWVEVEEFDSYLLIKTGPLPLCCCCQKAKIEYNDILKWQLYPGSTCATIGIGYTFTEKCRCIKTMNLKPRVQPIEIVLKPNNQSDSCAKSITFQASDYKNRKMLFDLLQQKCADQTQTI